MDRAYEALNVIVDVVKEQAEDEGLWFDAQTASEAFLQKALRRLHAVAENALMVAAIGDVIKSDERVDG